MSGLFQEKRGLIQRISLSHVTTYNSQANVKNVLGFSINICWHAVGYASTKVDSKVKILYASSSHDTGIFSFLASILYSHK
jgi:hypothetical protein